MATAASSGDTAPAPARATRPVLSRLVVLALAVAAGLLLQRVLLRHLETLGTLARTDPFGARRELAMELRFGGLGLFALTAVIGAWCVVTSVRAHRAGQFPPPGTSWGAARTFSTGVAARRAAVVGIVLGTVLLVASVAGGAVTWRMADVLLACRAR